MTLRTALEAVVSNADLATSADRGVVVVLLSRHALPCDADGAWSLLDAAERARVDGKRRPADRETTAIAYACHRCVLSGILRREPGSVPLFRDPSGAPRLRDERLWTSLSHADPFIAIAVSARGPVGVDVEPAGRAAGMVEIAARVCHASELATIEGLPADRRGPALLALWVRKEALLKAAGVGLAHEMTGFAAPADDALPLPGARGGPRMAIAMLGGGDCVGAVAFAAGLPVARFGLA